MKLFDRLKQKLGMGGSVDEVVQAAGDEGIQIPANREYIRAFERSQRLRGPGYTRPYRKGRTKRSLDA